MTSLSLLAGRTVTCSYALAQFNDVCLVLFQFEDWYFVLEFLAYTLAFSNSALNPIIYAGFNENFRSGNVFICLLSINTYLLIHRLTLCLLGNFACFLSPVDFFKIIIFFRKIISLSRA